MSLPLIILAAIAFYVGFIISHELGHLVSAVLVGWKPVKLSLGRGKRWKTFKFGDFQIQLRLIPFGGFALSFPPNRTSFRVRKFIVAAGGPIATALLALLLSLPLVIVPDDDQSWRKPLTILFVGMCITVVENLFPHMVRVNGQKIPSDGLSMWRMAFGRPEQINIIYAAHAVAYSEWLALHNRLHESFRQYDYAFLVARPSITYLRRRVFWIQLLEKKSLADVAKAECQKLLVGDPKVTETQAGVLDAFASIPLYNTATKLVPDALGYINEAISLEPENITLLGTKGALLIESGNARAGSALLAEVRDRSKAENDQEICAYYLALAHFKLGDTEKAKELLAKAISTYPTSAVRARIEAEVVVSRKVSPVPS